MGWERGGKKTERKRKKIQYNKRIGFYHSVVLEKHEASLRGEETYISLPPISKLHGTTDSEPYSRTSTYNVTRQTPTRLVTPIRSNDSSDDKSRKLRFLHVLLETTTSLPPYLACPSRSQCFGPCNLNQPSPKFGSQAIYHLIPNISVSF